MSAARQADRPLDVRALSQTREFLVCQNGGLFPVLTVIPENAVVAAVRGGAGHLGLAGRIDLVRSFDAGLTWSPPAVVVDSDWDDRDYAFGVTPAGTLILAYHREGGYTEDGVYLPALGRPNRPNEVLVTRSADGGLTWDPPALLNLPPLANGHPFGKIVALGDGTLLLPIYSYAAPDSAPANVQTGWDDPAVIGSYVVRSRDGGSTWTDPTLIAPAMNETALHVLPDGDVLAVMRGSDAEAALWTTRSTDGGRTWSAPAALTAARQHPADLVLLADGSVLLTYGNRTPPYRIEGRLSRDGGRTWLDGLLTFSGPLYGIDLRTRERTDLGYPSTVVVEAGGRRRGVTAYYVNPGLPQTGDWRTGNAAGPFYRADGYRAVAVSWDEAELLSAVDRYFG